MGHVIRWTGTSLWFWFQPELEAQDGRFPYNALLFSDVPKVFLGAWITGNPHTTRPLVSQLSWTGEHLGGDGVIRVHLGLAIEILWSWVERHNHSTMDILIQVLYITGMWIFREYPEIRVFPAISVVFQWVFPIWDFFSENDPPQFILSTLKCNSVTPKDLKLHLQSIKLQNSFYSSNFCSFTCAVMLWFVKFQVFFVSTILIFNIRPWLTLGFRHVRSPWLKLSELCHVNVPARICLVPAIKHFQIWLYFSGCPWVVPCVHSNSGWRNH
jgi:hypothetical protein